MLTLNAIGQLKQSLKRWQGVVQQLPQNQLHQLTVRKIEYVFFSQAVSRVPSAAAELKRPQVQEVIDNLLLKAQEATRHGLYV